VLGSRFSTPLSSIAFNTLSKFPREGYYDAQYSQGRTFSNLNWPSSRTVPKVPSSPSGTNAPCLLSADKSMTAWEHLATEKTFRGAIEVIGQCTNSGPIRTPTSFCKSHKSKDARLHSRHRGDDGTSKVLTHSPSHFASLNLYHNRY
jgi:hypothetical protein